MNLKETALVEVWRSKLTGQIYVKMSFVGGNGLAFQNKLTDKEVADLIKSLQIALRENRERTRCSGELAASSD